MRFIFALGLLLAGLSSAQEKPAPAPKPAASPDLPAASATASKPKPLDDKAKLEIAQLALLLTTAELEWRKILAHPDVAPVLQALQSASKNYEQAVDKLAAAHGARGCHLDPTQNWIKCPPPVTGPKKENLPGEVSGSGR